MLKVAECTPRDGGYEIVVEGDVPAEVANVSACRELAVEHARKFYGTPAVRSHRLRIAGAVEGDEGAFTVPEGAEAPRIQQVFMIGGI